MKVSTVWCPLAALLLLCDVSVFGARILAMLPLFAKSHHKFFQPLLKSLAGAGHEVVSYSPFPLDSPFPNYTDVHLDNVIPETNDTIEWFQELMEYPHWRCLDPIFRTFQFASLDFINSPKIQALMQSKEQFDLVICEAFTAQEFTLPLGRTFNAPVVVLQAFMTNSVVNSVMGNSLSLPYIPDTCSPFSDKQTFVERLLNSFTVLRNLYYVYYYQYVPVVNSFFKQHFPGSPPFEDLVGDIALAMINDHMTVDYPQPRTPNIIPVGGIHIEDEKPLPKEIQTFMDDSSDGVILFSLGTYVPDELKPKEYFDTYIEAFKQLRQRVLWKTRKENIEGLPDNVKTLKWLPQRDVLAHPNTVLFITHAGLLSTLETVHCGVPVVAIPQFFDQHRNAKFFEDRGVGVRLQMRGLSTDKILTAIRTVLGNKEYQLNMQRWSSIFRDRPVSPGETVVFWVEHVLRHGAAHLKPASTRLSWYQLALLDVAATILIVFVVLFLLLNFLIRWLLKLTGISNGSKHGLKLKTN